MLYIKRLTGCLMLLAFPLILFIDLVFGFVVTGIKVTFKQSFIDVWGGWLETFWY